MRLFVATARLARRLANILDPAGDERRNLAEGIRACGNSRLTRPMLYGYLADFPDAQCVDPETKAAIKRVFSYGFHRGLERANVELRCLYRHIYGEEYNGREERAYTFTGNGNDAPGGGHGGAETTG